MTSTNKKIIADKSNEIFVFDKSSRLLIGNCPVCKKNVRLIFPLEAAVILDESIREIFRLIEAEKLHFIETGEKVLLICFDSVKAFSKRLKRNFKD